VQQATALLVAAYDVVQPPAASAMPKKPTWVRKLEVAHSVGAED